MTVKYNNTYLLRYDEGAVVRIKHEQIPLQNKTRTLIIRVFLTEVGVMNVLL